MIIMVTFLWMEIKGFVLDFCPHCKELYGYTDKGGLDLLDIFSKDSPIKNILKLHKFDLDRLQFEKGKITIEHRRRGIDLRRELNLRLSRPDNLVDSDIRRLAKLVSGYGVDQIRRGIFINRFEVINLTVWKPLQYRYHIQYVPAFLSPFAPFGMIQAVSSKEPEEEIEKLLFSGGSRIRPAVTVATALK